MMTQPAIFFTASVSRFKNCLSDVPKGLEYVVCSMYTVSICIFPITWKTNYAVLAVIFAEQRTITLEM